MCVNAWSLIRTFRTTTRLCRCYIFAFGAISSSGYNEDLVTSLGAALIWLRSKNSQSKEACIIDLGSLLLLLYYLLCSKSTIRNVEEKYLREGIWIRYPLIIALFISQWRERENLEILGKSLEDCECWIKKIIMC